ncbi:MAG: LbtU family siderophore porin [Desulfatiglandales bacterium]
MKKCKWILVGVTLFLALFLIRSNAHALSQDTELLLKLLEKKGIISKQEAATLRQEVEAGTPRALEKEALKEEIMERLKSQEQRHYHSVKGLAERLKKMEAEMEEGPPLGAWPDRIELSGLSGLIEVEASSEAIDHVDPAVDDERSSDIVLATVELGVDADIAKHVKGHILFLFEEDDTEPIEVDEGIISIDGEDVLPLYLNAGTMYVPFGRFESHFISDPLTLELGETRESAVLGGFANDWVELSLGTFNGDIDETGGR